MDMVDFSIDVFSHCLFLSSRFQELKTEIGDLFSDLFCFYPGDIFFHPGDFFPVVQQIKNLFHEQFGSELLFQDDLCSVYFFQFSGVENLMIIRGLREWDQN